MSVEVHDLIKANLNLYAVLQNLEELVRLDDEMAAKTDRWDVVIQFSVNHGPHAYLVFRDGVCTHEKGRHDSPHITLFFTSPRHFNAMFDGKAKPIPLKGFTRLGFLSREFAPLTDRLAYYLKPEPARFSDPAFLKTNTILTLHTAAFAAAELAALEPESRGLGAHMGQGVLLIEVLPEGPYAALSVENGTVSVTKERAERPRSKMSFKNLQVANDLLHGRVDSFSAVVRGDILLRGYMPLLDNANLILDRVRLYLS